MSASSTGSRRVGNRVLALGILLVALVLAGLVSYYASSSPDGLETVAEQEGFSDTAEDHAAADGPLADYDAGFDDERASVGVAGVVGVLATLALGSGIAYVVRRRPSVDPSGDDASARDDASAPTA